MFHNVVLATMIPTSLGLSDSFIFICLQFEPMLGSNRPLSFTFSPFFFFICFRKPNGPNAYAACSFQPSRVTATPISLAVILLPSAQISVWVSIWVYFEFHGFLPSSRDTALIKLHCNSHFFCITSDCLLHFADPPSRETNPTSANFRKPFSILYFYLLI